MIKRMLVQALTGTLSRLYSADIIISAILTADSPHASPIPSSKTCILGDSRLRMIYAHLTQSV